MPVALVRFLVRMMAVAYFAIGTCYLLHAPHPAFGVVYMVTGVVAWLLAISGTHH